jgi:ATP-dependent DNA helicase RecQ
VLLYDGKDRRTQIFFMGGRYPDAEDVRRVYAALAALNGEPGGVPVAQLQEALPEVARKKTRVVLAMLKDGGLARERRGSRFVKAREADDDELGSLAECSRDRGEHDREKLERMEEYARTAYCRWVILHQWFGEEMPVERCGECDNCRKGIAELSGRAVGEDGSEVRA